MITLILGGARSGKSSFTEKIAKKNGGDEVIYLATAEAKGKEMKERIKHHQEQRNDNWKTIEEPLSVGEVLSSISENKVVLVDCMTVYISNFLFSDLKKQDKIVENSNSDEINYRDKEKIIMDEMKIIVSSSKNKNVILVSNELGMGVVPSNRLGREFRDIAGRVNQYLAKKADEVYITIAGLPVELKELSAKLDI